jgi:hypothetical protein
MSKIFSNRPTRIFDLAFDSLISRGSEDDEDDDDDDDDERDEEEDGEDESDGYSE